MTGEALTTGLSFRESWGGYAECRSAFVEWLQLSYSKSHLLQSTHAYFLLQTMRKGNVGRVILPASSRKRHPPQLHLPPSQRHPVHRFPVSRLLRNTRPMNQHLVNTLSTNHPASRPPGNTHLTDQPPPSQPPKNPNIVNRPHHPPLTHGCLIPCPSQPPPTMRETARVQRPLLQRLTPPRRSHCPLSRKPYLLPPSLVPSIRTS